MHVVPIHVRYPCGTARNISILSTYTWEYLMNLLFTLVDLPRENTKYSIQYTDEEGDWITCSKEREWKDCIYFRSVFLQTHSEACKLLRIRITEKKQPLWMRRKYVALPTLVVPKKKTLIRVRKMDQTPTLFKTSCRDSFMIDECLSALVK